MRGYGERKRIARIGVLGRKLDGVIFLYLLWQGLKVTSQDETSGEDITHEWFLLPLQCLLATEAGSTQVVTGVVVAAWDERDPSRLNQPNRHPMTHVRRCTSTSTSVASQAQRGGGGEGVFSEMRTTPRADLLYL